MVILEKKRSRTQTDPALESHLSYQSCTLALPTLLHHVIANFELF